MTWEEYQLGSTISKAIEDTRLWQSEKGIVEISKKTLAIPIKLVEKEKGYIFHGHGKLVLDTIVETEEGAIGKPVEKELDKPFLMLGNSEQTRQHLSEVIEEDIAEMGYGGRQGFVDKAEDLFNRFFKKGGRGSDRGLDRDQGFIFAFQDQTDKLDILVTKDSKLVYTAKDMVFVSNNNNVVLKGPDEVVCSKNRKSVIIGKGKSVIVKR